MRTYFLRRISLAIPIVLGISIVVFTLLSLSPGDALQAMIPLEVQVSEADMEALRAQLGLDKPAPLRYVAWLGQVLRGNLGYSFTTRQPILPMILGRLPATLQLMFFSLLLSTVLGIVTGVIAAVKQYSAYDYGLTVFSFFWLSVPGFFLALLMIYIFAVRLDLFPAFGYSSAGAANVWLDRIHHLILPGFTLGLELTAALTRYVRSSLLEVLKNDYVRTARAKGLRERLVVLRHAFPNAVIPVITVIGLRLPALFGGSIVIETVFQWPGMGSMVILAANGRDYPVVMAVSLFSTTLVVASSVLTDLAYAWVDPRIRYS